MSNAVGAHIGTRGKRGTRGLAPHPGESLVYVFNFLQGAFALFHTDPPARGATVHLGFDPKPYELWVGSK
jgi:hypothetical protein